MSERGAQSGGRRPTLWGALLRALPVIVVVSLLTFLLDHYGWLRSFETAALDRFLVLRERVPANDVTTVEIDDADYEQLFHGTSPLDSETLYDLLDAVAQNQPKLIAVDIDTSAPAFAGMKISPRWPPIVWAGGATQAGRGETFIPMPVLGREQPPPGLSTGIALMPLDSDSRIRRFRREYPVAGGDPAHGASSDSFHWAVVKKFCELSPADERCARMTRRTEDDAGHGGGELILNLAIDPYSFDAPVKASKLLAEAHSGEVSGDAPALLSLKDKIVLLGGKYAASRDYYETPLGRKYGLDLAAIAIESELSGTGVRHVGHFALTALEVLAGLALVALNYWFPHGRKHLIALAAIPFTALLGSLVAFSSLAMWANFIPTLVASQIHVLYDKLSEARKLEAENHTLKARLEAYESGGTAEEPPASSAPAGGDRPEPEAKAS